MKASCMCGEPWRLESVHREKSPCFDYIEREWVGLTDEEIDGLWEMARVFAPPKHFYLLVEAKLKEKNT